jgi:hypothetical protein
MRSRPRTSAMLAAFVLALLAAFGLAAVSAEEQTGVILTRLPDKASAEYKALRDVGAPIGGRDLTMTGAEMWTVPEAHYAALRDAAMKQGVAVPLIEGGNRVPRLARKLARQLATPLSRASHWLEFRRRGYLGPRNLKWPPAVRPES